VGRIILDKKYQIDVGKIHETGEWGASIIHKPSNSGMMIRTDLTLRKLMRAVVDAIAEKEKEQSLFPKPSPIIEPPKNGTVIELPTVNRID